MFRCRGREWLASVIAVAALVCACCGASAGTISGTVTANSNGLPGAMPGASVTVLDSGGNTLTGLASFDGQYEIDNVLPGQATVTCRSDQGVFVGRKSVTVDQSTPVEADFDWCITASEDPFVPTGLNAVTLATTYDPGTSGLAIWLRNIEVELPLTETPPNSGYYSAQCDANSVEPLYYPVGVIWRDGYYNMALVDSSFSALPPTGELHIASVSSLYLGEFSFDPGKESLPIRADGVSGLNLQAEIFQNHTEVRTIPLTEADAGIYGAAWDGKDDASARVSGGLYSIYVYNSISGKHYSVEADVIVEMGVISVTVGSDPFIPTGCNSETITVNAYPNQTDLEAYIEGDVYSAYVYLTENPLGSGTYSGQWYGINQWENAITPDCNFENVYVVDPGGQFWRSDVSFKLHGVAALCTSTDSFDPVAGQSVGITASTDADEPAVGLLLDAQIVGKDGLVRTIPLTESPAGTYQCSWDGKDANGIVQNAGSYTIYACNRACSPETRYHTYTSVVIDSGISSIEVSPDPFIPTGCNTASITVKANPNQTGLQVWIHNERFDIDSLVGLTENPPGSGTYLGQWNGLSSSQGHIAHNCDGVNVQVMDANNNASDFTTTFRVHGLTEVTVSPTPFDPVAGQICTITATTYSAFGLHLEARIQYTPYWVVKVLPMVEGPSGTYHCTWDGSGGSGIDPTIDGIDVFVYSTDCNSGASYTPSSYVEIGTPTIGMAKRHPDGSHVEVCWRNWKTVSAVFPDCFYIEEWDRSSGLKVVSGMSVQVGDMVCVSGSMDTNLERQLIADDVARFYNAKSLDPVLITGRSLGGSTNGLCLGVSGGSGLNNIGLLVKCAGKVTSTGGDFFYLEDGSMHYDGSDYTGVRVQCDPAAVPQEGSIAEVTGIVSCEKVGEKIRPLLRTRSGSDVLVIGN